LIYLAVEGALLDDCSQFMKITGVGIRAGDQVTKLRITFNCDGEEEDWMEHDYDGEAPSVPQILIQLHKIELDIRLVFYGHERGQEPKSAKGWFRREHASPKRKRRRLKVLKAIDTLIEELQVDHVMKATEGPFY